MLVIPVLGGWRHEDPWGLPDRQSSLISKFYVILWHVCDRRMHWSVCTYIPMRAHTHTLTIMGYKIVL